MCDVYEDAYFSLKNLYKWAKRGFATTNLRQKESVEWKLTDSSIKKKFHEQWSLKKVKQIVF